MSNLTDFYQGTGRDARGRTIAEIWAFSDRQMEEVHDFIQWMFPLPEPSQFNTDAPLLTANDRAAFARDPSLRDHVSRSFGRFLAFLGLRFDGAIVAEADDFAEKSHLWRVPNHNWLRITRVLRSTRLLGLVAESDALFRFLTALRQDPRAAISADTYQYWRDAASSA